MQSGAILRDCKLVLVVLNRKGKGNTQGFQQPPHYYLVQCARQGARPSIADAGSQPAAEGAPT